MLTDKELRSAYFESTGGVSASNNPHYKLWAKGYMQGRADMHKLVMETWDAPASISNGHISDRLLELK